MSVEHIAGPHGHHGRTHVATLPVLGVGACLAASTPWLSPASMLAGALLYASVSGVVVLRLPGFHPFDRFGPANLATLSRAALVALLVALLVAPELPHGRGYTHFALAVVALALDGLDGWLARRTGMVSRFGARFDMEVDAMLILALSVLAWVDGKAGIWVLAIGLMRYAFVTAGMVYGPLAASLPPSQRRKVVCVLQMTVLAAIALPTVQPPWSGRLALTALVALCWSFLIDVVWLARAASKR